MGLVLSISSWFWHLYAFVWFRLMFQVLLWFVRDVYGNCVIKGLLGCFCAVLPSCVCKNDTKPLVSRRRQHMMLTFINNQGTWQPFFCSLEWWFVSALADDCLDSEWWFTKKNLDQLENAQQEKNRSRSCWHCPFFVWKLRHAVDIMTDWCFSNTLWKCQK